MSAAFAQAKTSGIGANVSSLSLTLNSSTAGGNSLIVGADVYDTDVNAPTALASVTDNKDNTFTKDAGQRYSGNGYLAELQSAHDIAGGESHQITVTPGDTVYLMFGVIELSGLTSTDQTDSRAWGSSLPNQSSPEITPTADGMAVAQLGLFDNPPASASSEGWTSRCAKTGAGGTLNIATADTVASEAAQCSWTHAASEGAALIASYEELAAGGRPVAVQSDVYAHHRRNQPFFARR